MVETFLALGLLFLCGACARVVWWRRRERRALRELGSRERLNYSAEDLIGVYTRFCDLELMQRGHSHHTWNVLFGTTKAGLVTLFCFSYEQGLGANRQRCAWWVAVVESPEVLPAWSARYLASSTEAWAIDADRRSTRDQLDGAKLAEWVGEEWAELAGEVRGRYVMWACPYQGSVDVPERLLKLAGDVSRRLASMREKAAS